MSVGSWNGVTPPATPLLLLSLNPALFHGPLPVKWDWIPSPSSPADLSLKHYCLGSEGSQLGTPQPPSSGDTHATSGSYPVPAFDCKHLGPLSCHPYPQQACSPGLCVACPPDSPQGLCAGQMLRELNLAARALGQGLLNRREGTGRAAEWLQGEGRAIATPCGLVPSVDVWEAPSFPGSPLLSLAEP